MLRESTFGTHTMRREITSRWSLLLLALLLSALSCTGKRSAREWSKMNLEELEKQWEHGDDEEELKTEQQAEMERLDRRRKEAKASAGSFDPKMFNQMDAAEIGALAAGQKDMTGPTMMFASVVSGSGAPESDGAAETLTKEETDDVAGRLRQLALLGGLELSVYTIDAGSVLISTQRGWEGKEILAFLRSRAEVTKVTWNSKEFFPASDQDEL